MSRVANLYEKPSRERDVARQGFFRPEEKALADAFLRDGYLIRSVEDKPALNRMTSFLADAAANALNVKVAGDPVAFLNGITAHISPKELNEFRLHVIGAVNRQAWFRESYFSIARTAIETLVGNELAMQRNLNLSIQIPHDDSSLLPIHADVFNGDSPYEVVLWLPFVDCFGSKSMFILPPGPNNDLQSRMVEFENARSEDLFLASEKDLQWLRVSHGQFLIFSQNLFHGNRVNTETETRWSMNCRFKNLLSPYADKKLGEFFEPITVRPATRLGLDFEPPEAFSE